jgi:tight adherence protein B
MFLAITLIMAALLLLLRNVVVNRRERTSRRLGLDRGLPQLSLLPFSLEQEPARGMVQKLDRRFSGLVLESGLPMSPQVGLLVALAAGLLTGGIVFIWRDHPLMGIAALVLGMLLTIVYYVWHRARRLTKIQAQLPDVMDLLARAVRAGESLEQAIALVGETALQPLGTEFRRCGSQLEMGLSVESAMRALVLRAPIPEMRILAATLMMQRQSGGNLPVTLGRLSKVIRDRLSYFRQFRAATAAGRFSTLIIGTAAPMIAIYMFIFQRDYVQAFLMSTQGQLLLGVAIVLQVIGLSWIYGLLRSDY